MQIATPFPLCLCACVCVCLCVCEREHVACVFALRAIDIGSVNPILSTSLQQQDIIHKTNINMHVAWHTLACTHSTRVPLRCPLHMPGLMHCRSLLTVFSVEERLLGFPVPHFMLKHTHVCVCVCVCVCAYTSMQIVCCVCVPRVMFDTAWVLPQQLTSLLMRRALSSSQMAPPGTLPHTHTHTHTYTHTHHTHTLTRRHAHIHIYTHAHTILSPPALHLTVAGCQCPSPLPLHFSPALSLHPSPPPSLPHSTLPSLPPFLAAAYPCRSTADVTTHQLGEQQGRRSEEKI